MIKAAKLVSVVLFGVGFLLTTVSADINKGKKIYMKKLKPSCGLSGVKFARMHTQDEWETIKEAGKMKEEIAKICPKSHLEAEYENDIYDFSYAFARDSGNIPTY